MALNSVLLVPISILKMPRNPLINCRNNEYLHIYGVIHLFECMGQMSRSFHSQNMPYKEEDEKVEERERRKGILIQNIHSK